MILEEVLTPKPIRRNGTKRNEYNGGHLYKYTFWVSELISSRVVRPSPFIKFMAAAI
jgi:hypothetical protein